MNNKNLKTLPLLISEKKLLLEKLQDWQVSNCQSWLIKEFNFKDFKSTLKFVNQVGEIAEKQNHHPNIKFTWGFIKISIQTHDIKNLSYLDFGLAEEIDKI